MQKFQKKGPREWTHNGNGKPTGNDSNPQGKNTCQVLGSPSNIDEDKIQHAGLLAFYLLFRDGVHEYQHLQPEQIQERLNQIDIQIKI